MNLTKKQKEQIECLRKPNFLPIEFFYSRTAEANGITNLPKTQKEAKEIVGSLMIVADKIQQIRDFLGYPIKVNSAYRCLELNRKVGSSDKSQHLKGQAIDFVSPGFGNAIAVFHTIKKEKIEVDQGLLENGWVHLSIKANANRNMWGKYIDGIYMPL